jgi:hypothetical protein
MSGNVETVAVICARLHRVIADLTSAHDPQDVIRRKDFSKMIFHGIFETTDSSESDAIFEATFDAQSGLVRLTSKEHPDSSTLSMEKLNKRRVERFLKKLDMVNRYEELELSDGVFVIVDRGNLYIMRDKPEVTCYHMSPESIIQCMMHAAEYNDFHSL